MQKIKVGIVGFGSSAVTFHVPYLQASEYYEIASVVSSNPEKVRHAIGDVQVVSSVKEMLHNPQIELVIITTPTGMHYEMTKEVLQAGVHVVVEKPFVLTVQEADDLIALQQETKALLSVYQSRRYDSDFLTIQRLIREGRLGDVYLFESHFDRYRPVVRDRWRENDVPGSGILYDLGSHLIDQALVLFGMPETVTADILAQRPGARTDDFFHVTLQYERLRVVLHASNLIVHPGPRLQVHGDKGSYIKHGIDAQVPAGQNPRIMTKDKWEKEQGENVYGQLATISNDEMIIEKVVSEIGSYQYYYDQMFEAIRLGKEPPVTAEEARKTAILIDAAKKSSLEGKTIRLPLP
ncbi:oxidoreductase [Brevibacillus daliensis]|uniref:oxidoreductase n=1 Tax=Brevibacillus daliensis TaxID=2892995 RepID=UPI001E486DAF|nr:oxidoreductase [Brevibacillus daliensis]